MAEVGRSQVALANAHRSDSKRLNASQGGFGEGAFRVLVLLLSSLVSCCTVRAKLNPASFATPTGGQDRYAAMCCNLSYCNL
jgi:hypothetical protein